jgi:hypothetical protein
LAKLACQKRGLLSFSLGGLGVVVCAETAPALSRRTDRAVMRDFMADGKG